MELFPFTPDSNKVRPLALTQPVKNWICLIRVLLLFSSTLVLSLPMAGQSQSQFRKSGEETKTVKRKGQNLVAYDNKLLHYGFFLAFNRSRFRVNASPFFNQQLFDSTLRADSRLYAINPQASLGFTTGFILNIRLFDLLDARVLPTVSFYQRFVDFRFQNDSVVTELKQSTFSFLELPLLLKYKSQRRNNTRMYIIAGIKPAIEVGSKKKEIQEDRLRSNTFDLGIEYGLGFDLYYPLFKFSPEIRFSHGIPNLRNRDPNPYSRSIQRMYTHTVTVYLNFE